MSRLLRPLRTLSSLPSRGLSPLTTTRHSSFLQNSPAPPRLPADQQAEFERLQRAAEAALSSHNTIPTSSSAPSSSSDNSNNNPLATSRHVTTPTPSSSSPPQAQTQSTSGSDPSAGSFSGGMRQGAPPEFEGDTNPATGEVGGPKNEPLRWGSKGDWSFNGRCTDF